MLTINEQYGPVKQGEGKSAGLDVVFLRLGACNLACVWCFVGNTFVYTPKGQKRIKDIRVNDLVCSADINGVITVKKVTRVFERELTREQIVKVSTEGKSSNCSVFCTLNHEFFTNRGWVQAANLHLGDEINYIDTINWKMKNDNPSCKPEAKQRLSEGARKRFLGKRATYETRLHLRESKLGPKNPRYLGIRADDDPAYLIMWDRIREDILERDNNTCQNKQCSAIKRLEVHHVIPYRISKSHAYSNLITLCKKCHLQAERLIINTEKLEGAFALHNGKKVVSVSPISIRQAARFNGNSNAIKVYNLEVEDNHTYFANNLLVHNCDTPYTWNFAGSPWEHPDKYDKDKELHKVSTDAAYDKIYELAGTVRGLVVSGGEPLLQQKELVELFKKLKSNDNNWWIEVETNGTLVPRDEFIASIDQFNCSPKLSNAGKDNPRDKRLVWAALVKINYSCKGTFKFVIQSDADLIEMKEIIQVVSIEPKDVWLMPEGRTKEEQLSRQEQVKELASKEGYNFSPRLHILEFGNKRGI